MLDIHLPHGKLQGFKEFFLHLFTITIGLLIALSLEGWVEYRHHQHLAREAEESIRAEITNNAHEVIRQRQMIKDSQKQLEADLKVLAEWRAHPHAKKGPMDLKINLGSFNDMAWRNAQNTGAVTFMRYKDAQSFSDIYTYQDIYFKAVMDSYNDLGNATSLFISSPDDWVPTSAQFDMETDRIGKLQYDLWFLSRLAENLDRTYQKFESAHK